MEPGLGWAMPPSAAHSEKQRSLPNLLQEHFPALFAPSPLFPRRGYLFINGIPLIYHESTMASTS